MKKKELARIAYHEAGHAVMHLINKKRFKKITTIPNDKHLGAVMDYGVNDWAPSYNPDKEVMIYFAGEIAENKYSGKKRIKYHGCAGTALDIGLSIYGEGETCNAYLTYLFYHTKDYVDSYWSAIDALAKKLIEKREIGYFEAREIVFCAIKNEHNLAIKIFEGTKYHSLLIDFTSEKLRARGQVHDSLL
jgi:hypothetical protein